MRPVLSFIPKPEKDTTRKLQTNITYEHWCKNPQQSTSKQNSAAYNIKMIIHHDQVELIPGMQGCFNIWISINVMHHINGIKENNTIISIDAEKATDKIQYSFMIKNTQQTRNRRKLP